MSTAEARQDERHRRKHAGRRLRRPQRHRRADRLLRRRPASGAAWSTNDADALKKTGGFNANLWVGLAMIVFAAAFALGPGCGRSSSTRSAPDVAGDGRRATPGLRPRSAGQRAAREIAAAASRTAPMISGLGRRPSRSTGPEIETAPSTAPAPSRTGADSEATPGSRSATLCAQPRRRTSSSVRAVKLAAGSSRVTSSAGVKASRACAAEPGGHRQPGADRDGVAQPAGALGGGDADPRGAVPDVELGALAAGVAQGDQVPAGELGEVGAAAAELGERRAGRPGALGGAPDQPVPLQGHGQPVGRRPGQAGAADELGERRRLVGDGAENGHRFVQDGDGVRLSHTAILASHIVRWPVRGGRTVPKTLAEKVYDAHVVRSADGRARPALHRPAPRARGHQPAGVRRPPRRRPHGPPSRPHDGDRGPQRPDPRHPRPHRRPGQPGADRGAAEERRRVRHPAGPDGRPRPGHRARHRPAARA